jgi:1-acyl-sn-glycerol-3-phosphate acyltransferase
MLILRALFFVFVFVPVLCVFIPVQFVITRLGLPYWNALPRAFHRLGCVFLGLKVTVIGKPESGRPTLVTANHISWTDIIAIGSAADVTFVAKSEVRAWFFVGFMASLQKTIFVDYGRKRDAARTQHEMAQRLAQDGVVLLFAEGHRDLGAHVQPFRSALIGAAQSAMAEGGAQEVMIQPLTIAYTRLQGLPVGRTDRSIISGITARGFREVVRELLTSGVKDVTIAFGIPRSFRPGDDRKVAAQAAENDVRRMLVALNRGQKLPADAG